MIKKITFLCFIGWNLIFFQTKAQPGGTAYFPYLETFDTLSPFQAIQGQGYWMHGDYNNSTSTSDVNVYASRGISNSQAMTMALNNFSTSDSILSPFIGDLTATSEISFYYRIVQPMPLSFPQTLHGNGGLKLSILTFTGTTPDPIQEIYRISAINHSDTAGFRKITVPLTAFAGKKAHFKFSYYQGMNGDDYLIDIDSLMVQDQLITQTTSSIVMPAVTLQLIQGYTLNISGPNSAHQINSVVVYDLNGKVIHSKQYIGSTQIETADWSKGLYLIQISGANMNLRKKLMIQ